jgi:3-deoxy-D-arabino-heptulosonate 7-phosphate (DAHP) synthase class II
MTIDVEAIRAQAAVETDGFAVSTGEERALPDAQPHVVTYYRDCPDRIALKPATLVERDAVIALCDALDAERERVRVLTVLLRRVSKCIDDLDESDIRTYIGEIPYELDREIKDALAATDDGGGA